MFSHAVITHIDIEAGPQPIWQVVSDLAAFDDWNPMLRNVKAPLERGGKVSFEVQRKGASPLKLKAKITELKAPNALIWRGGVDLLITGEHYFRIEQLDQRHCRFHHGEYLRGLLLPLLRGMLKKADEVYESMNIALKQRVEQPA